MDKIALFNELEAMLAQKAKAAHVTDLNKYYLPESMLQKQSFYFRLASSLQNGTSSGMDKSIKFNGENRNAICEVLFDCDFNEVCNQYDDAERLYNAFVERIHDSGAESRKDRADKKDTEEEKKAILARKTNWEKYAQGLYEGATFLKDKKRIINRLLEYNNSDELNMEEIKKYLGEIITDITGLGTALCCDWLKECGCTWLVKPDIHIKMIYQVMQEKETGEKLNYSKIKDFEVINYYFNWSKDLQRAGKNITVYQLDKMIWLICTGEFYLDKDESIGRNKIIEKIQNQK